MIPTTYPTFRTAYRQIIEAVLTHGDNVAPRGRPTRELRGVSFGLASPHDAIYKRSGYNVHFAAAEALQLIAGTSDAEELVRINPTMLQFTQRLSLGELYLHGAYGPRIRGPLQDAVAKIEGDRDTRQAVVPIFRPGDLTAVTPDIPCTLLLHFQVRHDLLELDVTMRSNDIYWGTPYDVFYFTQLQLTVARSLNITAGAYRHHTDSLHAYARDIPALQEIVGGPEPLPIYGPTGIGVPGEPIHVIQQFAGGLLYGNEPRMTASEQWYADQLNYVSPRYDPDEVARHGA